MIIINYNVVTKFNLTLNNIIDILEKYQMKIDNYD
jgi:hypothetical protein